MADFVAARRRIAAGPAGSAAIPLLAGSAAPALAELIRATGLTGLVRPASQPAAGTSPPGSGRFAGRTDASSDAVASGASVGLARFLPVLPELAHLLPGGGLRRGTTVAVSTGGVDAPSPGATSLLLALLAAASRAGSWCAVVGVSALGVTAAAELGIDLGRLALAPNPGPQWPAVVAAFVDGMDIVVTAPSGPVAAGLAGRLAARARQRGSVLMPYGDGWPAADVTLTAVHSQWHGLGQGRGRLRGRQLTITARGRGTAARPKQARVWLPAPAGTPRPGRGSLTLLPGFAQVPALEEAV